MPTSSYSGVSHAHVDDSADLVQITKELADSSRVVIPAANLTEANQIATDAGTAGHGASAANPLYVYRVDLEAIVRWDGSGWATLTPSAGKGPYRMQAGRTAIEITASTANSVEVSFNSGRFTAAPIVTASIDHNAWAATIGGTPTTSGATIWARNILGNSTTTTVTANWVAVQMTPTAGAG